MSHEQFWTSTPREYARTMDAFEARLKWEAERDAFMAYQTGAFAAAAVWGKLPPWSQVLRRMRSGRMSSDELKLEASLILGVPAKPISEAAKQALLRLKEQRGG